MFKKALNQIVTNFVTVRHWHAFQPLCRSKKRENVNEALLWLLSPKLYDTAHIKVCKRRECQLEQDTNKIYS